VDKQQTILKQVSYDTNQSILPTKLASYFPNYANLDLGPQLLAISVFDPASNYAKLDLGPKLLVISVFDTASSS
jgi:hypothetical protein